jgi:transposase
MSDFIKRPQIEVLSAADVDRRRYWSDDDKLRIVEESLVGHRQAAATARRHGGMAFAVRC